jgi:hypothetical protein
MINQIDMKIWEIKNKIADITEYISSDFCTNCVQMYKQREVLEKELKELESTKNQS